MGPGQSGGAGPRSAFECHKRHPVGRSYDHRYGKNLNADLLHQTHKHTDSRPPASSSILHPSSRVPAKPNHIPKHPKCAMAHESTAVHVSHHRPNHRPTQNLHHPARPTGPQVHFHPGSNGPPPSINPDEQRPPPAACSQLASASASKTPLHFSMNSARIFRAIECCHSVLRPLLRVCRAPKATPSSRPRKQRYFSTQ